MIIILRVVLSLGVRSEEGDLYASTSTCRSRAALSAPAASDTAANQHSRIPRWWNIRIRGHIGTPVLVKQTTKDQSVYFSGRFVKQEQWERWPARRKLVYGSKYRERFCGSPEAAPRKNFRDCICKILQYSAFLAAKWFALPSIIRSDNWNGVPTRYPSKWPPVYM